MAKATPNSAKAAAKKRIVKSANLGKPMSNSSKPRLKTRDKGAIIPKVFHESK